MNNIRADQFFNYTKDSYLERTSRYFYAVVFLLPFIIVYEIGTILINTDLLNQTQVRVMAFVWVQRFFEYLGCGGRLAWAAPPLFIIVILMAMHITSRKQWYICIHDMVPMLGECVLLAVPLIVLSVFLNSSGNNLSVYGISILDPVGYIHSRGYLPWLQMDSVFSRSQSLLASIVTGIGAGIYEELIFRLILISFLLMILQDLLRLQKRYAVIIAVFVSAALFSAHHHINILDGNLGQTNPMTSSAFIFRTLAGIYFAIIYAVRGFGITSGTHAFYDILATLLNAAFFQ